MARKNAWTSLAATLRTYVSSGSRIARHSLYLAAVNAVRHSGEWRTVYLRKKAQGKTAKQAMVVVAVKLLHAVYTMLKHRQPYNPSRLLVAPATIGS